MTRAGAACVAASVAVAFLSIATTARAQEPPATCARGDSAGSLAARVVAETLMGSGLGTAGFLVGPEITAAACRTCVYAAGLAGANALFPLGVYWGGNVAGGKGSFWLTTAGPWLVSATAFGAVALDDDYDGKPAFQIGAIGGAVAAPLSIALYEVTHARRRRNELRKAAGFRPLVAVGPREGGLSLHVAGQF